MLFALCIMVCIMGLSTRPKTSFKDSDWKSGHRFQPLPNLKVKGYCEWEMRLNTDFNRIPPIITELVCSNPETTCSGNTFFKVIYICRYIQIILCTCTKPFSRKQIDFIIFSIGNLGATSVELRATWGNLGQPGATYLGDAYFKGYA